MPALPALLLSAALAAPGIALARPDMIDQHALGRVLVQPRPGLPLAELEKIARAHGGKRGQSIRQINVHVIELPPQANPRAVAAALSRNRNLKFAEVDGLVGAALYPDDARFADAWHLPKIGAPAAWDYARGTGVTIAVIDTGVDATHPDLQSQIVPGWNFFDNNGDTTDAHGHGTAVAGIAAAASNNGMGVASVGFDARIMPMRVTDASGYGFFSLIASAIVSAADNGARVANASFLGLSLSATVDSAAQYMRSKGGVVVTSGGNTGEARAEPVLPNLTVVSSTDIQDAHSSSSSWGDYIDIAAPGVSILTTARNGNYGYASGTSASAPVVAGVYALMISAKPALSPAALDDILFTTAVDLGPSGYDVEFGHGRVNAAAAVAKAAQSSTPLDAVPPSVSITSPTGGAAIGLVPVDVSAADDTGVTRVELYANNALVAIDTTSPYGFTLDASKYQDGAVTLVAKAYDAANNVGESSPVSLSVSNDTVPPTVMILSPSSGSTVGGTVTVSVSAIDNVKVAKVSLSIDGTEVAVANGASLKYSWSVPAVKGKGRGKGGSTSSLSARAEDAGGNVATATISVTRE